jgi:hypothetical protein
MKAHSGVRAAFIVLLAAAIVAIFSVGASAASKVKCPSGGTPAAGSKVKGGLEVDGLCVVSGLTVNGGLIVDATGRLSFQGGTINGGVAVNNGGELDINALTNGSGAPTGTTATVNGGVTMTNGLDIDIFATRINGPLTINGVNSASRPVLCGNTVTGPASLSNAGSVFGSLIGYPAAGCPGNRFQSLLLTNAPFVTLGGNTIRNKLLCTSSTVFVPAPNTIGGTNTCY